MRAGRIRVDVLRLTLRGSHPGARITAISLEPVDSVTVTTLIDNVTDAILQDQGPAKRLGLGGREPPRQDSAGTRFEL
jgi:hypothetical protein